MLQGYSYPEIVDMAMKAESFKAFVQPDDPSFANPPSMLEAIDAFCERTGQEKPANDAQVIRLIFESLALRYRQVLEDLDVVEAAVGGFDLYVGQFVVPVGDDAVEFGVDVFQGGDCVIV